MGHVMLLGLGSSGDVNPLLGIGVALRDRGHAITLVSAPQFANAASCIGAEFASIGSADAYDAVYADPDLWHPRRGLGVFFPYAADLSDQTATVIEDRWDPGETVLVGTFQCFGARVAQEKLGAPLCTVLPNPILLQSAFDPGRSPIGSPPPWLGKPAIRLMYWVANREISRHARAGVNAARAKRGLDHPVKDIVKWSRSPDRVLALWPDALAPPQPDWPAQVRTTGFIPYDGPTAEGWRPPDDLPDRSDWIVFTPGTQMTHGAEFFSMACAVAESLESPTLLVTKDRSALPDSLPQHVWHLDFAPFAWLFERAAVVVHHGGIGTAGRALEAGVPQLIIPSGFDQYDNAERVVRLGVGGQIRKDRLSARRLLHSLEGLLSNSVVRERCAAMRDKLAEADSVAATCCHVEQLLDGGQRTS